MTIVICSIIKGLYSSRAFEGVPLESLNYWITDKLPYPPYQIPFDMVSSYRLMFQLVEVLSPIGVTLTKDLPLLIVPRS